MSAEHPEGQAVQEALRKTLSNLALRLGGVAADHTIVRAAPSRIHKESPALDTFENQFDLPAAPEAA